MTKNEYYVNTKNPTDIIKNDTSINITNRIKLKSMIREDVKLVKNKKNNLNNIRNDTDTVSIDLKNLKEEHINNSDKRVKVRSIVINNIANRFTERLNKSLSKINARTKKDSVIVKNQVDACSI